MKDLQDIKKIPIPFDLPGGPGPANVYLIFGNPLSLIDTGPRIEGALQYIEKALESKGYKLKDIERIYLTHGHIDHFGLAHTISTISDAPIFIHREDRYKIQTGFEQQFETHLPLVEAYFQEAGVPNGFFTKYKQILKDIFNAFAEPVQEKVETLLDGETIDCGERKLQVIHLPGHSPGSVSYYDQRDNVLFSGDHLLADITPNPLLELYAKKKNGYQSLKSYLQSLKQTRALSLDLVLPGHGHNISNPKTLIEQFFWHHESRKNEILKTIYRKECNKWEICCTIFGELGAREVYLGLSEVEGHLELLEEEGKALKKRNGHQFLYYAPNF